MALAARKRMMLIGWAGSKMRTDAQALPQWMTV
jgi:hypothetical protein